MKLLDKNLRLHTLAVKMILYTLPYGVQVQMKVSMRRCVTLVPWEMDTHCEGFAQVEMKWQRIIHTPIQTLLQRNLIHYCFPPCFHLRISLFSSRSSPSSALFSCEELTNTAGSHRSADVDLRATRPRRRERQHARAVSLRVWCARRSPQSLPSPGPAPSSAVADVEQLFRLGSALPRPWGPVAHQPPRGGRTAPRLRLLLLASHDV